MEKRLSDLLIPIAQELSSQSPVNVPSVAAVKYALDTRDFQSVINDPEFNLALHDANADADLFTPTPYWRYLSGWQQRNGTAVATNANYLFQDFSAVVGATYILLIKVSTVTAGALYLTNRGGYQNAPFQVAITQPGTYSYKFMAIAAIDRLHIYGDNSFVGVLESVDVGFSSAVQIEQDLSSNATGSVPSVAAVGAAIQQQQQRLDNLINGAPQALDTLAEIASQLKQDEQGVAAILATQQQLTQQLTSNVMHVTGNETITGVKTFMGQLRVNYSPNQDTLYFKGGPGQVDSLASIAFDTTTGAFGRNVSARYTFRDDGLYGAHHLWETKVNAAFDTLTQEKMRLTRDGNLGVGIVTPVEKIEVAGNVKAIYFIGNGSQLTDLPKDATKADLASGKIPTSQLPTRDPYAIQDNTDVAQAVVGGTYTNGELLSSSSSYSVATGPQVAAGDRIVSTGYVHEYCRTAAGTLGWVRWPKG